MSLLRPGEIIDQRYELVRPLGSGAQGALFVAVQRPLDREVAVKVLAPTSFDEDRTAQVERFRQEASALARLSHPCCVQVFDYGVHDDRPYLVMELLQGVPLTSALRGVPWPAERALHVAFHITRGLSHAHAAGIVHRDLSPNNVMLLPQEEEHQGVRVKLVDFGLARSSADAAGTDAGQVQGTPAYLAPERIQGDPGTPASDVYAVGVMLFEMLTGRNPLRRRTPISTFAAVLEQGMPRLGDTMPEAFAEPLCALVDACTAADPARRPADGAALRQRLSALRGFLDDDVTFDGDITYVPGDPVSDEVSAEVTRAVRELAAELGLADDSERPDALDEDHGQDVAASLVRVTRPPSAATPSQAPVDFSADEESLVDPLPRTGAHPALPNGVVGEGEEVAGPPRLSQRRGRPPMFLYAIAGSVAAALTMAVVLVVARALGLW